MRYWLIACAVLALGLLAGCKKDEAATDTGGTTGAAGTTADNGKAGPVTPPDVKETGGGSTGSTTGGAVTAASVAGTYDTVMDDAAKAELEKAGTPFGGGTMKFNEDGTFEGNAKVGKQDIQTKGTFTVEGDTVTTIADEMNGQKMEKAAPPQKYTVSSDGKELKAEGAGVVLKKQ